MALYEYEAQTIEGVVLKGKMEAFDEAAVTQFIRKRNYYPTSIRIYKESQNLQMSKFKGVSIKDISIFCRQFSFSISAGISILNALEMVKDQTENSKLKEILGAVFQEVQKGVGLSVAMGAHKEIPGMLINMIAVGEVSGTIDTILERMSNYYDKEYRLNQKIKQALTYPILVSVFAILVVVILVTKVLPTFIESIASMGGGTLPLPTRMVMGLSNALRTKGFFILAIIVALAVLIRMYIKSESGEKKLHMLKLNIPIFGKMNNKILTAKFARTFGILMASGVPLIQSMDICAKVVGNRIAAMVLESAQEDIKKGISLGEALGTRKIFPKMLTQMIKIGEESGTLDVILEKTAEFYDSEVETVTAQLTAILEPLIIIVLAAVVGFIILAVIMPMFGMYNVMNSQ
jgi:type IV pilus assembly protein PilC